MADQPSPSRLRHASLPAIIFLVVAIASIVAALALWRAAAERDAARFQAESRVAALAVFERMERQVALLRGAAGLFAATGGVDARAFDAYVERLELANRYPGVLGIGYSPRIVGAARDAFVSRIRAGPASDFRLFPEGARAVYQPIVYLSPLDRGNRRAVGFDMFTESMRRTAMIRARDEGTPAATGRVALLQDAGGAPQPGFLLYVPVYRGNGVPVTPSGRNERLDGFVFSPVRARDLFRTVFDPDDVRPVDVTIYDATVAPANVLFATATPGRGDARFYEEALVRVAGRTWVVATAAPASFSEGPQRGLAWWTAILGVIAASVLAFAAHAQGRAARAAERARADLRKLNETLEARVEARTAEVSTAYAGLRHEIELREGAEEQVRQMQKIEAVGQLTGGIAHDFNNMLAIVIGSLDMAKRRVADPDRVRRLLDNAMEGATRAAALTQRLLAFSRRQPLSPQVIDVNRLVSGMSELLRRTIGETIRLDTALSGGLWPTFADAGQLENVILNLAVNARDAMLGGSSLSISTANRSIDAADVARNPAAKVGDHVTIVVADTGEGMPPEIVAKAFDPFFTTKEIGKGTGLGLSQVLGFIQQSGGYVEIESEPGVGTTIKLFLPRHTGVDGDAAPAAELAYAGPLPRGTPGEIILVVEDEDQVRLMSVEALRDLGYTVLHASGGAAALDMLRAMPGIRLLFTDVVMPEMNGRQLADAAIAHAPDLKLLFTTGYTHDAVVHDGRIDAGVDLISKPFTFEQLAVKVRGVLDA